MRECLSVCLHYTKYITYITWYSLQLLIEFDMQYTQKRTHKYLDFQQVGEIFYCANLIFPIHLAIQSCKCPLHKLNNNDNGKQTPLNIRINRNKYWYKYILVNIWHLQRRFDWFDLIWFFSIDSWYLSKSTVLHKTHTEQFTSNKSNIRWCPLSQFKETKCNYISC